MRARPGVYGGRTYRGRPREIRGAAGLEVDDRVTVVLEQDDAPRVVAVRRVRMGGT